jgi:DNA-binding LacI/PurR family transcriptional regulator/DNA-binding transcriptional regulator YhcF (GntR family)
VTAADNELSALIDAVTLDRTSPVPLYFQAASALEAAITSGKVAPGALFEGEKLLADQLGLSRPTLRRAMQNLVDKGLIVRRQGVGTRVVQQELRPSLGLTTGYDDLNKGHQGPGLEAIEELQYRPSAPTRGQAGRRTNAIGVLLDDLRNPWFVELLEGMNSVFSSHGVHMLLADQRLDSRTDGQVTRAFVELQVDGLALVGSMRVTPVIREAVGQVPTVVAASRDITLPYVDVITNDDVYGGRLGTEHLIGLGHSRIAHISGTEQVGRRRQRGYEDAMRAKGLADQILVEQGDMTEEGGYRAAVRLLTKPGRPTAIFAYNDVTCVGALDAADELGLAVPGDVSLVGYDNNHLAGVRHIWLTTVDNASHEVGRRCALALMARIESPTREAEDQLVTPGLVVRGSTAAPPEV